MSKLKIQTAEVFLPLLEPNARYKAAHGGRGSGKSHFFAELLVEHCLMNPGTRAVCIREIQKDLKHSAKALIEDKIRSHGLVGTFVIKDEYISTPGGGLILFQGMQNHTADSVKSLEGFNVCWVEEAQTLSQRSLDLLRPTIRTPGSQIWFSWNPSDAEDPVDAFLRGNHEDNEGWEPPPRSIVVEANYCDNPWFPDVLREEMEYDKGRDQAKFSHVWMGTYWLNTDALVFTNWEEREFDTPPGTFFRYGADWGYSIDPTVLVRCWIDGKDLYVDQEAWQINCDIDHTPDLFDSVPDSKKWPITADSARPEMIAYMSKRGYKIHPATKGAGSVEDGIEWLKSFNIIVHPRCKHVIQELRTYSWKIDPKTEEVLPVLKDKHNHTIDSLRYGCEGARRAANVKKKKAPEIRTWRHHDHEAGTDWMAG